jgi:hypothetical protein
VPLTAAVRVNPWPAVTGFGDATRPVDVDVTVPFTVTDAAAEVLVRKVALPMYSAVRLYVPAAKDEVESVATPEELTVAEPSDVTPL